MTLEDAFGESFAQEFEQERTRRVQERNRVSDETKQKIAQKIVEEDALDPKDPVMEYTVDGGVTHDVLLMTFPNPQNEPIWTYLNELQSGGATIPMDYMGDWMNCLFNDKEMLKGMEPGNEYIIIGNLDQWVPDDGEPRDQVSPVRGVIDLEEIKEYAQGAMDSDMEKINEGESSEGGPEGVDGSDEAKVNAPFGDSDDEEDDSEEEEKSSSNPFGSSTTEDEEGPKIDSDNVAETVKELYEREGDVILEIEEGDDELEDLAVYHMKENGFEEMDEEVFETVKELALDGIESLKEDEEEEEDDLLGDDGNIFG